PIRKSKLRLLDLGVLGVGHWTFIGRCGVAESWSFSRAALSDSRRRDIHADGTLVTGRVDGGDAEHPVIDVHLRERVLGHVPNGELVLPVGRPRVAPEDAIARGPR